MDSIHTRGESSGHKDPMCKISQIEDRDAGEKVEEKEVDLMVKVCDEKAVEIR